jgi:SAM-dependent methyltransferase
MTSCILCDRESDPLFSARDYRRPSDPIEYTLNWCKACNFGRLAGHFSPMQISKFYEIPYYTHGSTDLTPRGKTLLERVLMHLAWRADRGIQLSPEELGPSQGRTLCDLGCGNGSHLAEFAKAGFRVMGVEPDPAARKAAQQLGDVFDGTAENLPSEIANRRFDVVLVSHVLEHCIDPLKAIGNMRSILAPNGKVVIEVPNNASKGFNRFKATWPWTDIPRHLNFFTEASLRAALAKQNMSMSAVRYVGYNQQFSPEWIRCQNDIWNQIGAGKKPNFKGASYRLLALTAFANDAQKYESIRVHAVSA